MYGETQPTGTKRPRFHGHKTRGEYWGVEGPPQSSFYEGRFGRMFRRLPVFLPDKDLLRDLGDAMREEDPRDPAGDNEKIPAGYTYLGQFIDHDITFDPTSTLQRANDPNALVNFRTPRFDLDSLYGSGPADSPFMYDQKSSSRLELLVGKCLQDENDPGSVIDEDDLPRNPQGRALIGDPRNDENTFISQLQLSFIKFHNKVVREVVEPAGFVGGELWKEAQRVVRWHYQWVVLHDFLVKTVGQELVTALLPKEAGGKGEPRCFYRPKQDAYMPVEFSVAAYRFGHSQVRAAYRINNTVPVLPIFRADELDASGNLVVPGRLADFRGFRGLPPQWTNSWPFFFPFDDQGPVPSRKIDTRMAIPLYTLPGERPEEAGETQEQQDNRSLARRNLLRGWAMQLPDGHRVAQAMGEEPLTEEELGFDPYTNPPPLWHYILCEAEKRENGQRLGAVGGRIVAEVFIGLAQHDPLSYLSVHPGWEPELPTGPNGKFDLPALLNFAVPEQCERF
jgi:hypothetical protein